MLVCIVLNEMKIVKIVVIYVFIGFNFFDIRILREVIWFLLLYEWVFIVIKDIVMYIMEI